MLVQQKQNTKGFSLLELLVIVVIVGIIGAISFPGYTSWSTDRKLRQDQEKISSLLSIATTQVERGSYAYVKLEFEKTTPASITVKGVSKTNFSKKINGPKDPTCDSSDFTGADEWNEIASYTLDKNTFIPGFIKKSSSSTTGEGITICFSKGGKYFKKVGAINLQPIDTIPSAKNFIPICHIKNICSALGGTSSFGDNYSSYLIVYSRFGLITKYKWACSISATGKNCSSGKWVEQ